MNKKVDVDRVWLSKKTSWIQILGLVYSIYFLPSVSVLGLSVSKEVSSLEDLFDTPEKQGCLRLALPPAHNNPSLPILKGQLKRIISALQGDKPGDLAPLFHPRLRVSAASLTAEMSKMESVLHAPLEVSSYRVWVVKSLDGGVRWIPCAQDDFEIKAHYGYPLQVGLWLQVNGSQELARLYVSLVPKKNRWLVGAFSWQKWTHNGQPVKFWASQSVELFKKSKIAESFFFRDIANKLSTTNPPVRPMQLDVQGEARVPFQPWLDEMALALRPYSIISLKSLLLKKGLAAQLTLRSKKASDKKKRQQTCDMVRSRLFGLSKPERFQGLYCFFQQPKGRLTQELETKKVFSGV